MYKSKKSYKNIVLSKDDLIELDKLIVEKFDTGDVSKNLTLDTPNRTLSEDSMEELLNESLLKIDNIYLSLYKYNPEHKIEKNLRLYIGKHDISVNIEGESDIWVNGFQEFFNSFFKERKSTILKISGLVPFISGGLIGCNIVTLALALRKENITSAIISLILFLFGLYLSYAGLVGKKFPTVKINLQGKKKIDRMEMWTILGLVLTLFGIVFSVMSYGK